MKTKLLGTLMIVCGVFLFFGIFSENAFAIPNPSVTYCDEQGYKIEERKDIHGDTSSVCIFPTGQFCELSEFYQGKCGDEFRNDLPCKKAGEEIKTGQCCEGLNSISNDIPRGSEDCEISVGSYNICSNCGNEKCEEWENRCNCPSDCEKDDNKLSATQKEDNKVADEKIDNVIIYVISGIGLIAVIVIISLVIVSKKKKK